MSEIKHPAPQDVVEALVQADPRVQALTSAYRNIYETVLAHINGHLVNLRAGALFTHLTEKDADGRSLICRVRQVSLQGGIAQVEWDVHSGLLAERVRIITLIELIQHHIGSWMPLPPEVPEGLAPHVDAPALFGDEEEDQPTAD